MAPDIILKGAADDAEVNCDSWLYTGYCYISSDQRFNQDYWHQYVLDNTHSKLGCFFPITLYL